jgi:hypothetical protein
MSIERIEGMQEELAIFGVADYKYMISQDSFDDFEDYLKLESFVMTLTPQIVTTIGYNTLIKCGEVAIFHESGYRAIIGSKKSLGDLIES